MQPLLCFSLSLPLPLPLWMSSRRPTERAFSSCTFTVWSSQPLGCRWLCAGTWPVPWCARGSGRFDGTKPRSLARRLQHSFNRGDPVIIITPVVNVANQIWLSKQSPRCWLASVRFPLKPPLSAVCQYALGWHKPLLLTPVIVLGKKTKTNIYSVNARRKGLFSFFCHWFPLFLSYWSCSIYLWYCVWLRLHFVGKSPCFFAMVACGSLAYDGKEQGKKTHGERSRWKQ